MKPLSLPDDVIDDLGHRLAMLTAQQAPELYRDHRDKFLATLFWNRRSCQPAQLTRRFIYASLQRRPRQFLQYVSGQRALLALAGDDSSYTEEVLEALTRLSSLAYCYQLGPTATDRQKRGLLGCEVPMTREHYAKLVRDGEVADGPTGLNLHRAKQRKRAGYLVFALFVAWTWLIFMKMAADGALEGGQLAFYMAGAVVISGWLVRGIFTAVRADEVTVDEVNRGLGPRLARGKDEARRSRRSR